MFTPPSENAAKSKSLMPCNEQHRHRERKVKTQNKESFFRKYFAKVFFVFFTVARQSKAFAKMTSAY